MRFRFFRIPVNDSGEAEAELDRFLASHRVVDVERHLVDDGTRSMWALCVGYTQAVTAVATATRGTAVSRTSRGTVDYRQVLSEEEFTVFAQLRTLRKATAAKEGIPPYQVFNNEHLAAMVRGRMTTAAELGAISGGGRVPHGQLELKPGQIQHSDRGLSFLGFACCPAPCDCPAADVGATWRPAAGPSNCGAARPWTREGRGRYDARRCGAYGRAPGQPRRVLAQHGQERACGVPQREPPRQPQPEPWAPPGPSARAGWMAGS